MEPDDFDLMEGVRVGQEGAFEKLVERYQRRLYRLAYGYLRNHEDALDAVQETMVKTYLARNKYQPRSHPFTWVSRILANHCTDQLRRRRVRATESLDAVYEANPGRELPQQTSRTAPDVEHEQREFQRRVEEAVASLPASQREIFTLRHFEEMSLDEIASARGCALGTVKSSLHRAAAAVRGRLLRGERIAEPTGS